MNIGSHEAVTPFERPHRYDPDWRNTLAVGSVAYPQEAPRDIKRDEYLRYQLEYLVSADLPTHTYKRNNRLLFTKAPATPKAKMREAVETANDIYANSFEIVLKDKLDALLLCEDLGFDDIETYTGLSQDTIAAYERIFFNVRDDNGKLQLGMWLREHFALGKEGVSYADPEDQPLYWRTLAMTAGSKVLLARWGWSPSEQLPEAEVNLVVFRNLLLNLDWRIRYGKIDAKSSMDMLGRMKELIDDMRARGVISSSDSNSEVSMIFKLLQETAPTPPTPTEKQLMNKSEDVQAKLAGIQRKFEQANQKVSLGELNKSTPTG